MTVAEANKMVRGHNGPNKFNLEMAVTSDFMAGHTHYPIDKLFEADYLKFSNQEEFDALDVSVLDRLMIERTDFKSWVDFLQAVVDHFQL